MYVLDGVYEGVTHGYKYCSLAGFVITHRYRYIERVLKSKPAFLESEIVKPLGRATDCQRPIKDFITPTKAPR